MGVDKWMKREVAPIPRTYDLEDFPGHDYILAECEFCATQFKGIFKTTHLEVTCPGCKTKGGVRLVRVSRKIYLQ
jgi:hypothetical protein